MKHRIGLFILTVFILYLSAGLISIIPITENKMYATLNISLISLSEQLLEKVKKGESGTDIERQLSAIKESDLVEGLADDDAKKTFWINIYNAWFQLLAVREQMKQPGIFTSKAIPIAGRYFSLDDIEHGILRRYRWKYSMGYFPSFFPGKLIKQLAVSTIDYRIHFALNCGAVSCPPILFYSYDNIESQLDQATRSFLLSETELDDNKKEARVSKILYWFKGDFGGTKGIHQIVGEVFQKDISGYRINFKPYNWAEKLHYFN